MSQTTRGNPRVAFRAEEDLLGEVQARQGALGVLMAIDGDAPLGSTARRDLTRYYQVVQDELRRLPFSREEVLLTLDAMNGVIVDPPAMYRAALALDVADHIRLNGADEKWGVDGAALVRRLESLSPGTMMALCDLAERFWSRSDEDTDVVLRDLGVAAWLRPAPESVS